MNAFPVDHYTPHGYLDVPAHTRRLTPKGVLRSHDLGFRWHFPAYAASYGGRRETYRAGLRIGVGDALAATDFDTVTSPYHSKNLMRFVATVNGAEVTVDYLPVGDDVVAAFVEADPETRVTVRADYTRLVAADHGWGESGLVGRVERDMIVLQGFEDGDAFVLEAYGDDRRTTVTADEKGGASHVRERAVTVLGRSGDQVELSGQVTTYGPGLVLLARGRTVDEAIGRLTAARRTATTTRAAAYADDDRFWSSAPRLSGDWPEHWRRGLVYDLETLRMMVKQPVGIYRHTWDAMQIQAPRVVLAEAAIDALLLGYADPEAAQEMLYGTFADAPMPNVPCSREDGSYNMVSADGTVCGTGPQWGYPWLVVRTLFELRPDHDWLARIYPHLAAYLDWWLAHRRDAEGWLVHACSWESGQDLSPRFGDQPLGGGHPTWEVRPVDLQAAFAHAAATMAELAPMIGRDSETERWERLAAEYRERAERLWNGHRYADAGADGRFTDVEDVMQLAPAALGFAASERLGSVRDAVAAMDPEKVVWPMFAWTAVDAATTAGDTETAARIAASIVDRAYRFWDAREHDEGRTLPGVACEYWPVSGRCGGEGYGWGAFTTHLVLGVLVGVRAESDGLHVRPNLPAEHRRPGNRYAVSTTLRGSAVDIALRPGPDGVEVKVNGRSAELAWGEDHCWSWEDLGT